MQKIIDEFLEKEKAQPLSDDDVLALVKGRANVIRIIDLDKYHSIDEMLYPYDQCILLYESKPHYGHWCCLTKYGDSLEFFDSYGGFPDEQLDYIDKDFAHESGQDNKYLTQLLLECPYTLSYNDHVFQKMDPKIATCGKWVAVRCMLKELPLEVFKDLFFGKYSDNLAAFLTSK